MGLWSLAIKTVSSIRSGQAQASNSPAGRISISIEQELPEGAGRQVRDGGGGAGQDKELTGDPRSAG